ncbi:MAG: hypothetical protein JWM99_4653 [Verrucomicrobiales bacterium]|nr:hypothetical protein [Verrucomicrobiales bacterium]
MAGARSRPASAKRLKFLAGLLLLPFCAGVARTTVRLIQATATADTFWFPFVAGAACWLSIYVLLPKPLWLYVCGHELTHALWACTFGGKVKKIKISARGGYVSLSKTNFLISLSPYFFPLYAVLILAGFILGHVIWGLRTWFPLLYLSLGTAYCFHVTLTAFALKAKQTDITDHGRLFSAVIIWLGNLGVLIVGLPLLTSKVNLSSTILEVFADTFSVVAWVASLFKS